MREDHRRHLIGRAAVLKQCANGSVWKCWQCRARGSQRISAVWRAAGSAGEAVWLRRSRQWCPDLHAAVSAVIGRSESRPTGSVCGSVGAPRGGRSANQMSPMLLAHRTTATLPIYSVLAVGAVVPPSETAAVGEWRSENSFNLGVPH